MRAIGDENICSLVSVTREYSLTFLLSSPAFAQDDAHPVAYTYKVANVFPSLVWSSNPENTKSLAPFFHERDAPCGTRHHRVTFNIAAGTTRLEEDAGARLEIAVVEPVGRYES